MFKCIRVGAVGSVFLTAISAHAVTFAFQTEGSYSEVGGTIITSESTPTYRAGHDLNLTVSSVNYILVEANPGQAVIPSQVLVGSGTITGTYLGVNYSLAFSVGTGGLFRGNSTTLNRSFAGDIISFNVVGSALNGLSGTGVFGGTYLGDQSIAAGLSKTSFDLDTQAVPEPVSMAALGIGLVGIASRRRRR